MEVMTSIQCPVCGLEMVQMICDHCEGEAGNECETCGGIGQLIFCPECAQLYEQETLVHVK